MLSETRGYVLSEKLVCSTVSAFVQALHLMFYVELKTHKISPSFIVLLREIIIKKNVL